MFPSVLQFSGDPQTKVQLLKCRLHVQTDLNLNSDSATHHCINMNKYIQLSNFDGLIYYSTIFTTNNSEHISFRAHNY